MASVFDVADYILKKHGAMSAMKLQKLVYYCQAWSLVWDDRPMFREKIYAFTNGPVVYALFKAHQGKFTVNAKTFDGGSSKNLSEDQRDTVDAVLSYYGQKSPQWLSDLTHMEAPWRDARSGLADWERGMEEISLESMAEYYSSLPAKRAR